MARKIGVIAVGVFALVVFVSGCVREPASPAGAVINVSGPNLAILHATVVDKTTKQPIQGVIVYFGYHFPETWRCHTDADGKCSISNKHFAGGDYGLNAFKKEYNRYAESGHFEKGDNYFTIELEENPEVPASLSITGTVIEIVIAKGTRSENHYFKIKDERGREEYIFNEIGENYGFDGFTGKKVGIRGFRELGFIGWQHEEIEGIYVEEINLK
jgi:hypothetical protein